MARFLITPLGSSKQNCDWHIFTVSILFLRKSFINNLSQSQQILSHCKSRVEEAEKLA